MVTIRPKLWPIGPVQQRTVTVGKMKISTNPMVANQAEMDRLKKANFQVQNNNLSFRAVSQIDPIHVVCVRRNRGIE